jgi:putative N6-adenine-specific DNA methylase
VIEQDFFRMQPTDWTDRKGLVVLNPPYGRRIQKTSAGDSLAPILDRLKSAFGNWRLALIAPREQLASIKTMTIKTYPLTHGGLRVAVGVGEIP